MIKFIFISMVTLVGWSLSAQAQWSANITCSGSCSVQIFSPNGTLVQTVGTSVSSLQQSLSWWDSKLESQGGLNYDRQQVANEVENANQQSADNYGSNNGGENGGGSSCRADDYDDMGEE
jgi:hypothetical protein